MIMENKQNQPLVFFWFRRDLRLMDNNGLFHALQSGLPVQCVFIFDRHILDQLDDKDDRRVAFIHYHLRKINLELKKYNSRLLTVYDTPENAWKTLIGKYNVRAVYTNHDYEPYAIRRDEKIRSLLNERGISFHTFKDQVIFEKNEVVKEDGRPYTVFTPYSRKYLQLLDSSKYQSFPSEKFLKNLKAEQWEDIIPPEEMGFKNSGESWEPEWPSLSLLKNYEVNRDFPALAGTSKMSVHLRFGTVSIRKLVSNVINKSPRYLNELIWREFYMMLLWHFPHLVHKPFKKEFENVRWRNNEAEFERWCNGMTGFPMVDAGMRELNTTGYMHNRLRMITASFLSKHLLIDWRWGEAYFASKLLDFELSSNNGGWQWAAGCGADAAPYFRIFNPTEQQKRFDPEFKYIKRWIPEFGTSAYPAPVIEHRFARQRCLDTFKEAMTKKASIGG